MRMTFDDNALRPDSEEELDPDLHEAGDQLPVPSEPISRRPVPLDEPDALAVAVQVTGTVSVPAGTEPAIKREMEDGAIALYRAFEPQDALESTVARLLVGATYGGMDCFRCAARSGASVQARDVNLRHAIKATLAVVQLVKTLDNHRGRDRQNVTVGQVNVQSGGQAIVGNVRREQHEQSVGPARAGKAASRPKTTKSQQD